MVDPIPTGQNLREEALAWRARVNQLEKKVKEQAIELESLRAQVKTLAIENVRLLNKKAAQATHATDDIISEPNLESMRDYT